MACAEFMQQTFELFSVEHLHMQMDRIKCCFPAIDLYNVCEYANEYYRRCTSEVKKSRGVTSEHTHR